MNPNTARHHLAVIYRHSILGLALPDQAEAYEALAATLPTDKLRREASHMAWTLIELAKVENDFWADVHAELAAPGFNGHPPVADGSEEGV